MKKFIKMFVLKHKLRKQVLKLYRDLRYMQSLNCGFELAEQITGIDMSGQKVRINETLAKIRLLDPSCPPDLKH